MHPTRQAGGPSYVSQGAATNRSRLAFGLRNEDDLSMIEERDERDTGFEHLVSRAGTCGVLFTHHTLQTAQGSSPEYAALPWKCESGKINAISSKLEDQAKGEQEPLCILRQLTLMVRTDRPAKATRWTENRYSRDAGIERGADARVLCPPASHGCTRRPTTSHRRPRSRHGLGRDANASWDEPAGTE